MPPTQQQQPLSSSGVSKSEATGTVSDSSLPVKSDTTLVDQARKALFADLPNFSGHPSDDAEMFLKRLRYVFSDDPDSFRLHLVRGKLQRGAGLWFDKNKHQFSTWIDFEVAFFNHYAPKSSDDQKFANLRNRRQQRGETVASYFDSVIDLCEDVDSAMSEHTILRYLIDGLRPEYHTEVSRQKALIKTPADFLHYARTEEELYAAAHSVTHDSADTSTFIPPTVSTVQSSANPTRSTSFHSSQRRSQPRFSHNRSQFRHSHSTSHLQQRNVPSHAHQRTPSTRQHTQPASTSAPTTKTTPVTQSARSAYSSRTAARTPATTVFSPCKVCGRTNHRTIDCRHKSTTGCFNCSKQHHVRDCTLPPSFQ